MPDVLVVATQSAIRRVVQEIAEDPLAIGCVLHRVKNVVVPEDIDVEQRRHLLIGKQLHKAEEAPVFKLHRVCVAQRPAFAGFHVHQFEFNRGQVQVGDHIEFRIRVHGLSLVFSEFVTVSCDFVQASSFHALVLGLSFGESPDGGSWRLRLLIDFKH
jgi:hypothetical protein